MKNDEVLSEWKEQGELDKKSAKKLVWRTRLSISFSVLRTLIILLLLYCIYFIPVSIFYDMSDKGAEFDRLVTTIIETRYPGIAVEKTDNSAEISPLLTQETKQTIYKKIGDWEMVVGEVVAKKRLFGDVQYTLNFNNRYLNGYENLNYAIAPELIGEELKKGHSGNNHSIEEQLNMIEDGYVVQLQFSTIEAMAPNELLEMLDKYDILINQMPVYGGEISEVDVGYARAGQITFASSLMLRPYVEYTDDHKVSSYFFSLYDDHSLQTSIDQFMSDLEWLVDQGDYYDRDIDVQRLDYLKENGIQVYGATITGPIREVEQLLEEELFYQFHIGGIEVWKWDEKNSFND
ncbi:anti sigma factor C-terminal domain-containing protein [Ornithinibacillus caprae]|nr:anti sigma factor C-terminal domain-containing protein [Ornithinibacillus caprae]